MRVCLLRCPACSTEVAGDFPLGRFARLTEEQLRFLETFIRCRGSLKDVGTAVGVSYPTARNRLDELIRALGLSEEADTESARRLEILGRLREGGITAEEALNLLQGGNTHE